MDAGFGLEGDNLFAGNGLLPGLAAGKAGRADWLPVKVFSLGEEGFLAATVMSFFGGLMVMELT